MSSQPDDPQDIFNDNLLSCVFKCIETQNPEFTVYLYGPHDLEFACLAAEQLKNDRQYTFSFEDMHRVLRVKIDKEWLLKQQ